MKTLLCFVQVQDQEQINLDDLSTIGIITAAAAVLCVIIGVLIVLYKRFVKLILESFFLSLYILSGEVSSLPYKYMT